MVPSEERAHMDTKWVVAAAVAAFVAFGGATWWLTSDSASAAPTSTSFASAQPGKPDLKARKAGASKSKQGGKAKATKGKAGKGGKAGKAGKGKAKAQGKSSGDPAQAAAKWEAFRGAIADGGHERVAAFGEQKQWDAAKVTSVQKLFDDAIAGIDSVAARMASGEIDQAEAKTEMDAKRKDMQSSLIALVGEADARELIASMKPSGAK